LGPMRLNSHSAARMKKQSDVCARLCFRPRLKTRVKAKASEHFTKASEQLRGTAQFIQLSRINGHCMKFSTFSELRANGTNSATATFHFWWKTISMRWRMSSLNWRACSNLVVAHTS